MPIPSSTDPISRDCTETGSQSSLLAPLQVTKRDILASSASTDPKSLIISISNSQDAQGLVNRSFSDGEKPSTQATEDQRVPAKSKKRSRRKAKKDKIQGQGSPTPAVSPDILPLDYCGPMPGPATSRRGPPITSPKPNVGSSPVPPPLAFAKPTKTEESLRQENEKLRRELEEANNLAEGLKEAHFRLGEEVEAWKQKLRRVLRGDQRTEDRGGGNDKFPHLQVL